jgi:hypothetical protein
VDFREIVGEHSGVQLAKIVLQVLELYGIKDKVTPYHAVPSS